MKLSILTGAAFALALPATALPILVKENDFESDFRGFSANNLINEPAVDGTGLTRYHGNFFTNESSTLTVNLAGIEHSKVALEFDLYLFASWDGDATSVGPDRFSLSGDVSFDATFTNHRAEGQSYPGSATEIYGAGSGSTQVYRRLGPSSDGSEFVVDHVGDTFSVTFAGSGLTDEWWGIDNVRVSVNAPTTTVPIPAGAVLLGTGLLGLGVLRRRASQAT